MHTRNSLLPSILLTGIALMLNADKGGDSGAAPEEPKPPKSTKLKFVKEVRKLADLKFSQKFQAREETDHDALADYVDIAKAAKAKAADSPFPALRAVLRNGEILVFGGFNRATALKKAGYEETEIDLAESDEITDAELFLLSIADNSDHGIRLTNADKLHNLLKVLNFYPGLTNTAYASMVGCSEKFVREHRPADKTPTVRTTKGGKKINTANVGKSKTAEAKAALKAQKAQEKEDAKAAKAAEKAAKKSAGKKGKAAPDGAKDAEKQLAANKKAQDKAAEELRRDILKISGAVGKAMGTGEEGKVRTALEADSMGLTRKDIEEWAASTPEKIARLYPLIRDNGWKPLRAKAFLDDELSDKSKVGDLINHAVARGGSFTFKIAGFTIAISK